MAKNNKPLPPKQWLEPRVKLARMLSLLLLAALCILLLIWNHLLADLGNARPWVISLVELLPLLLVAPGVILGSPRTHAWLAFVINLYFIKGVLAWFNPDKLWLGALETAISVALFFSALLYTRWRYQLQRHNDGQVQP